MSGYASATLGHDGHSHVVHTDALACTDTIVESYAVSASVSISCSEDEEQLIVPIDAESLLRMGKTRIPFPGLAFLPAGVAGSIQTDSASQFFVVSTEVDADENGGLRVTDLDRCTFNTPATSDVAIAHLTATLGCRGMKANVRLLHPGQHVPYHTEGSQEELFIPVRGPASMRIADASLDTPVGTIVRVAPEVPRSALNEGDATAMWVMVGAPQTGGATEWDPGAEILE